MKANKNLLEWVAQLREHLLASVAAFAMGGFVSVTTSRLDEISLHHESILHRASFAERIPPALTGIVGTALILALLIQISPRQHRSAVFVMSFFSGAVAGIFVWAIVQGFAR